VELDTSYATDVPRIEADPSQVEQVLMNLAVNARDAMPGGGTLDLETRRHEVAPGDWFGGERPLPGTYACIRVSDSGCGMGPETEAHVFEPFFTTKAKGEGTGLGLATSYGVVTQAGGHIELRAQPGRGTTVAFILPATSEPLVAAARPAPAAESRPATILVVEDEEEVRSLAERILTGHGYTVLSAQDPYDAILTCDRHSGPIDLLLTDVVMPRMAGPELAERVAEMRPDIGILFMSGYPNQAADPEALTALLPKPFNGPGLTRAVADALMDREAAGLAQAGAQASARSTASTIASTPGT
jgi:CheY-like chemotaxis protein